MIQVRINGEESMLKGDKLSKVSDLIELIKTSIDPEHMITEIKLDGKDLPENSWFSSVSSLGTSILEIDTDSPQNYVDDKIRQAPLALQTCYSQFRDARKSFQEGKSKLANQKLVKAVETLNIFFKWYSFIFALMNNNQKSKFEINAYTEDILSTCKSICEQQLYQSWWAISESIEKQLEPKIDKLENFFREALG